MECVGKHLCKNQQESTANAYVGKKSLKDITAKSQANSPATFSGYNPQAHWLVMVLG